jgi:hypothetical protein
MRPVRDIETRVQRAAEERDDRVLAGGGRDEEQQLASGRPSSTPFAVTGIVAIAIWAVVAVVVAFVLLVFWLS